MTYGLILSLVMIILAVIAWIGNLEQAGWFQWISWAAYLGTLYYTLRKWRDEYLGGVIGYGKSVSSGTLFMFFGSIIYGFYFIIYTKWIDPEYLARVLDAMEELYYSMKMSEETIEASLAMAEKMRQPGFLFFSILLGNTLTGFILSLIVSFFVRKEGDPYQQAMRGIDSDRDQ